MPRPKHLVTPVFGFEYPELGAEGNAPEDFHQLALQFENLIKALAVSNLASAGAGDSGKILIVGATGVPAWQKTKGDLENNKEGTFTILAEAIVAAKLANLAVTEAKLAGEAVAEAKIKALAVTAAKLANLAVTTEKINTNAVTESKITANAVNTSQLVNLAATAEKLAAEAVEEGKIKNLAVTAAKLGAEAVSTAKLANLSVTTEKIAALAITEAKLADGAVTSRKYKPTVGVIYGTGELVLTSAMKDVESAKLEITPPVASLLRVTAVFRRKKNTGPVSGGLNVDGVINAHTAMIAEAVAGGWAEGPGVQVYQIPLTAAPHTIKLQAELGDPAKPASLDSVNCAMSYELVAS